MISHKNKLLDQENEEWSKPVWWTNLMGRVSIAFKVEDIFLSIFTLFVLMRNQACTEIICSSTKA